MDILDFNGVPLETGKVALKVRLAKTFRASGQGMGDIVKELHSLTPKDMEDFKTWYESAGYPCT